MRQGAGSKFSGRRPD